MRLLAIGDIHGCHAALEALESFAEFTPDDRLIFLGDYVDRGPDSNRVIDWMIEARTKYNLTALRGNHEAMMLLAGGDPGCASMWLGSGGLDTLFSYSDDPDLDPTSVVPSAHRDFLESTERYVETDEHIFVHAGTEPDKPMSDQDDDVLYWSRFTPETPPHCSGKTVICGHTVQPEGLPVRYPFGICIDTGAWLGRWLTCLDVLSGEYWQADIRGRTRKGVLSLTAELI